MITVTDSEVLLLFQVGERRFATAARSVRRVIAAGSESVPLRTETVLGRSATPARALVADLATGEEALAVDAVQGMVAGPSVHALPALAAACMAESGIAGLIEHGDELIPLVDLQVLLRAAGPAAER